jgi:protoporphyrinogen oxidase
MNRGTGPVVIVGGGLAALYAAYLVRKLGDRRQILIVERAPCVGGLLRALDAGRWGHFDQGMHTFTSCGNSEIDDDITGLLPAEEWVWLKNEARDISGLFFAGMLQHHCHYPDLRLLGPDEYRRCVADFFCNLSATDGGTSSNMDEYGRTRFGDYITEHVMSPILEKLYGRPASAIDPVVATLLPLDRVALLDEPVCRELLPSALLRRSIAYPEQRRLPLEYASGRFSVYPKRSGAFRLIDALVARLEAEGVHILTRTDVEDVQVGGGRVRGMCLVGESGTRTKIDEVGDLWWTAGVLPLAKTLRLPIGRERFDAPKVFAVMNLLLSQRPAVDDLYYFWCFDERHPSFRITNVFNYSPGAVRNGGWPICVEFYLDPHQPLDNSSLVDLTVRELRAFGVYPEGAEILASAGYAPPTGFPILSCANRRLLEGALEEIAGFGLENLGVTGIQSAWGVVFQPDVLVHTWRSVRAHYGVAAQS